MDRDEAIRRAEIARKWAEGEVVQAGGHGMWTDINGPDDIRRDPRYPPKFFDETIEWRIKPKPLECWAWWDDGANRPSITQPYIGQNMMPEAPSRNGRWVSMREVTNETDD